MAWVLKFDGHVYREADVTIGEAEQMEEATRSTWRVIDPFRSALHARAILQTFLVSREGMSEGEAAAKVRALTVPQYLDLISTEDEDADLPTEYADGFPPAADATSTPT
jgi:hypothetical protein